MDKKIYQKSYSIGLRFVANTHEIPSLLAQELGYPTIHPLGIFSIPTSTSDMAPNGFNHCQFTSLKVFYFNLAVLGATQQCSQLPIKSPQKKS